MQSNYKPYEFNKSLNRLDAILNGSFSYQEINSIPNRDKLSFNNGYYVNCCALFVDIRKSSELPKLHKRPVLARIYRSYISEIVSILNSYTSCKEINIIGDCVSGIFDAQNTMQIREVYTASHMISGIVQILNHKLSKRGIIPISIGIGLAYGRALMIKTGAHGSGINDVIWMGEVVNQASNYCNMANKQSIKQIVIDSKIYACIDKREQQFFSKQLFDNWYHGNVVTLGMHEWLIAEQNKKQPSILSDLDQIIKRDL